MSHFIIPHATARYIVRKNCVYILKYGNTHILAIFIEYKF